MSAEVKIKLSMGAINFVANVLNIGYSTEGKELDDIFLYKDIFEAISKYREEYRESIKDYKVNEKGIIIDPEQYKKHDEILAVQHEILFSAKQVTFLSTTMKETLKKGIKIDESTAGFIREIFTEIGQ